MNTESKSIPIPKRQNRGYTLVETLIALMILTMLTALAISALFCFNQIQNMEERYATENQAFEKLHLYFQRQIETSEKIYIKDGHVYLQDMETRQYYNKYQLKTTGILYRIKTTANLNAIGNGASSQLERGIADFSLTASIDDSGTISGSLILRIVFKSEKEKIYETIIAYPGGSENIFLL